MTVYELQALTSDDLWAYWPIGLFIVTLVAGWILSKTRR